MSWRRLGIGVSLVGVAGLMCAGCGDSSDKGLSDLERSEATASSAQSSTALSSLALQASLNEIDATYAPLTGPPTVTPGGANTSTSGTVNVDFGAGTIVNNATVVGQIDASYAVAGNVATVTITYTAVTVDTAAAGLVTLTGIVTITVADVSLAPSASGTIVGTLSATSAQDTTTITPNLTYVVSGAAPTTIVVDGTLGIVSSAYTDWDVTFTAVTAAVSALTRSITSGTINLVNVAVPTLSADFVFTGPNTGTVTLTPTGISATFTL